MKIGIVINTKQAETVWNALRFGLTALFRQHFVKIFLLGEGVEIEKIKDEKFDIKKCLKDFIGNNGEIIACGTCLKLRKRSTDICPVATMKDLVSLVEESDKVLVFN
ncbi:MAG: DsrE family protein [Candidatus Aminicenantia bacterium]